MHKGECERAYAIYLKEQEGQNSNEPREFELLGQSALALIEEGMNSADPEIQLLSLYGAGIALNRELLPLLGRGIESSDMRHQLIALSFLERYVDDEADEYIKQALGSPFLLTRLEAAYILAGRDDGSVVDQLESLYIKVPEPVRPLFAEILSQCDGPEATRLLRQMLSDSACDVRIAAILAVADSNRETLLPQIRSLMASRDFREEEAAAATLGVLQDSTAKTLLKEMIAKRVDTVKIAAALSLKEMGEPLEKQTREAIDPAHCLFALSLLRDQPDELMQLLDKEDFVLRINAGALLLAQGKLPPLPLLSDMLITDERDLGFIREHSPGHTLFYWRPISSASQHKNRYPSLGRDTALFKASLLKNALLLDEEDFFTLINLIFKRGSHDLILMTMELLLERPSARATALVKSLQEHPGAPFIRIAALLVHFQMTEDSTSEERLLTWLSNAHSHPLIRFKKEERAPEPTFGRTPYMLTPDETSELLILVFETMARTRKTAAVDALIRAIAYGNPKNRYALAGLLIKATE